MHKNIPEKTKKTDPAGFPESGIKKEPARTVHDSRSDSDFSESDSKKADFGSSDRFESDRVEADPGSSDRSESDRAEANPGSSDFPDYVFSRSICSSMDCTGLIPALPSLEAELEAYEEMYQFCFRCALPRDNTSDQS
jgi:hypothetical protein